MISKEYDNIIFIKLNSNEYLFESLKKIFKKYKMKNAIILSGIGQLKNFTIGYFNIKLGYIKNIYNKPYELLNLSGNIIKINDNYEFHIHAVLSDDKMKTIGGHLFNGKVEITNEIVLLKTYFNASRVYDNLNGLKKLSLK
jgi:predicted DNA-binding protein with PD1-like motif